MRARAALPDFLGNHACPQRAPESTSLDNQDIFLNRSVEMAVFTTLYQPQLLLAARFIALHSLQSVQKTLISASPCDVKKLAESYTEL